jgi:hypothetical protein
MVNLLSGMLVGMILGLAFFPESIGKTIAQVYKGYLKEMNDGR